MDSAYLPGEQLAETRIDSPTEKKRLPPEHEPNHSRAEPASETPPTSDASPPATISAPTSDTPADYPTEPSDPSEAILYDRGYLHSPTVEALVSRMHGYYPGADGNMVRKAYAVAHWAHRHQRRKTGDPYIDHPVAVASFLLDLQLDSASIAAALLHDVVEDTGVILEQVEQMFGSEVAVLVDGVTKLSELEAKDKEEARAGTYRKLFLAIANDPRVVLIKLSDRLHNMRTLQGTSPEQQQRVARETMEIYAPLAHRVGMWQMKSELEDLAFRILDPQRFQEIERQVNHRNDQRERTIQRMITKIRTTLDREGIGAQVYGRPKHIYSIYRKMERKGVSVDRIYDQLALRIILDREDVGDCYRVLGLVHGLYIPIMEQFDDYIAMPKDSHYQSLHTAVIGPGGSPCEVQIRTRSMHDKAEFGIAAHWRYKEGFNNKAEPDKSVDVKLAWLRELLSWSRGLSNSAFMRSLKDDFLDEQIYVLTPKGRVIELPEGSTPVDFAYRIHSEVGHRCSGAKINGRIVPLDYKLKNSEIVEIMTSRSASRGPSRDWLNFVRSDSARSHIRRYFRRQERGENLSAGRILLEKELKRLGLVVAYDEIAQAMNVPNIEHLFVMIGSGDITARTVAQKLFSLQTGTTEEEPPAPPLPTGGVTRRTPTEIQVRGESGILTRLARCCNPVIGDPIVGFVTRGGKGVTVHRTDCRTVINERDKERLIDVTWGGASPKGYPVPIRIETWDRVGLWADISYTIADAGINIEKVEQGKTNRSGRAVLHVTLTIQSADQFTRIIDKLNRIPDVIEARRVTNARSNGRRN